MIKTGAKFHFNPPIQIKGDWMIGLTSLEVHSCIFNIAGKTINLNFIQTLSTNFY